MAINPKDKLKDYTNRDMLRPDFPEAPTEITSVNHRIRQGRYNGKILKKAYEIDPNYFENGFFNLPSIDVYLSVKDELRSLSFDKSSNCLNGKTNLKSEVDDKYLVYFKELDYKEMWIKFFKKLENIHIHIKDESNKVIFKISKSVKSNQVKFPLCLKPGVYRLFVEPGSYKEYKFRVIEKGIKEYSVVESIREKLHEFSERKEIFNWLRKRKYSNRQAKRIICQVYDRSF